MENISKEYVSSMCEIRLESNEIISTGVISEVGDDFIKVAKKTSPLRLVGYNTRVKISIFNTKLGFVVITGNVLISLPNEMKIMDILPVVDRERRDFFRVDVDIPTRLTDSQDKQYSVIIKDISLSGMKIKCSDEFRLGEQINIDVPLKNKVFCWKCIIKRRIYDTPEQTSNYKKTLVFEYGCSFNFDRSSDSDMLCSFIFQKQREQLHDTRR